MDDRITEFVRGLRAAGVRVSLAEGIDAFKAVGLLGIEDKDTFRESLRTTLIKENRDFRIFDELFPVYFAGGEIPMEDATEELTDDELNMLNDAMGDFNDRTQQLLEWLTSGEAPSAEQLEELAKQMSDRWQDSPRKAMWVSRSMMRELGLDKLAENLQKLIAKLREMGVRQEAIDSLLGITRANEQNLRQRMAEITGLEVARERAEQTGNGKGDGLGQGGDYDYGGDDEIMQRSFESLGYVDSDRLRTEIRRLVTVLRSRAALRRKKGKKGKFDPKSTIRQNQRYGGVPLELKFKRKKLKPSIVFFVDVSGSMERIVEFLLRFMYHLDDQMSRVQIFTYYADLQKLDPKVTELVGNDYVEDAFYYIRSIHPYKPYATNLGRGLVTFFDEHLSAVDSRTTVVFLGDGRNNYTDPRADLVRQLRGRAKKLYWLNPERPQQWTSGDSDMPQYLPQCDDVYVVRNLAQLSNAIDKLLAA